MRSLRHPNRDAVLITEAPLSADEEFSNRRRRYLLMMLGRAVCVLGAVLVFHVSGWLAAAFLVGAAVLPWSAVLLANNKPARQAVRFRRYLPGDLTASRELTAGDQPAAGRPRDAGRGGAPTAPSAATSTSRPPGAAPDPSANRVIDL